MTTLDATTFDKVVVFENGQWEQTQNPPECYVGGDYMWAILAPKCAVAWSRRQLNKTPNRWWAGAKLKHYRPINGPIVIFRHWAAFKLSDLVLLPCFKHANFSALEEEQTDDKWVTQSVQLLQP